MKRRFTFMFDLVCRFFLWMFFYSVLSACSNLPVPEYSDVIYDYQVKPPYALNNKYKFINVSVDNNDVKLPGKTFEHESIKFAWTPASRAAQIVVYIHLSNSFLIDKGNTLKTSVEYNEKDRGYLIQTPVQQGNIRTHYTIEVVDRIKDTLIRQVSLTGNYGFDAELTNDTELNKKILKKSFHDNRAVARQTLMNEIWEGLKTHHLRDVQTSFGQIQDKIVSDLPVEPIFNKAFTLLSSNRKHNAAKALNIYNQGMALYKDKDDDLSLMIKNHLDHGITVSTKIANNPHRDRY